MTKSEKTGTIMSTVLNELLNTVIAIAIAMKLCGMMLRTLWITSPSGKTTRKMPFLTALRIIRKHGWHLTPVVPTKSRKPISRWQALEVLFMGDN